LLDPRSTLKLEDHPLSAGRDFENINTKKKNTVATLQAGGEVSLQVNTERTKCMAIYLPQMQGKIIIY